MRMLSGELKFWVCWFGRLRKIGELEGEGVKSDYKSKGLIT